MAGPIDRYVREAQGLRTTPIDRQAGAVGATVAHRVARIAERNALEADRRVARQALNAGRAAGGSVDAPQLQDPDTIAGDNFNRGARLAHAAAVETDVRENVARLEANAYGDPERFNRDLAGYTEGLLEGVDGEIRPDVEALLGDVGSRARLRVEGIQRGRLKEEQLADITRGADGLVQDALRAARAGELGEIYGTGDEPGLAEKLDALYAEGVQAGLLDAVSAERARQDFRDQLDGQAVLGGFERVLREDGLAAAEKALRAFEANPPEDLDVALRDSLSTRMHMLVNRQATIENRRNAARNAAQVAQERALSSAVTDAVDVLEEGYELPEGELEALLKASAGTKHEPKLAEAVLQSRAIAEFSLLSDAQRAETLNQLQGAIAREGADGPRVRLLRRLRTQHDRLEAQLESDPLALAIRQGVVEVPVLDPGDPSTFAARREASAAASAHYGFQVSPLTSEEANQFARALDDMSVQEKALSLSGLVSSLGDVGAAAALEQMDKGGETAYALAGGLVVDGAPEVAELVLNGREVIAADRTVLPKDQDLRLTINDALRGAYAASPVHRAAIVDGVKAVYASLSQAAGDFTGELDDGRLERAIDEVTGGVIEFDPRVGTPASVIPAPARGVSERDFSRWMRGLTAEDVAGMGGVAGFTDDQAAELIRSDSVLVGIGVGRYEVRVQDVAGDYRPLLRDDGQPFELVYGERVPEASATSAEPVQLPTHRTPPL